DAAALIDGGGEELVVGDHLLPAGLDELLAVKGDELGGLLVRLAPLHAVSRAVGGHAQHASRSGRTRDARRILPRLLAAAAERAIQVESPFGERGEEWRDALLRFARVGVAEVAERAELAALGERGEPFHDRFESASAVL